MQKKLVIISAPTGGNAVDREGAQIPTTPEEIAEEAYRSREAGAAIVHIHARDPKTKLVTSDLVVFSDIITRIRDKCDILIQTTTGMGLKPSGATGALSRPSHEERFGLLSIKPRQDLATIPPGSWDLWRPGGTYRNNPTYQNPPEFLIRNITAIRAAGLPWEMEIADTGFLTNALRLADEGVFDRHGTDFWLDYCMGFGAMPSTARHLVFAQSEGQRLFPQAKWAVLATERDQFPMNALGVAMGCDIVRVGFEDNIYLPNGEPARHNYQLVEAMARIARDFGREVASVDEARAILGIARSRQHAA
jgi:3-keto-5-aminohexanoate cleavage enzyme